jgi:alkyl hydroperoxide reductase subunit AhpF
MLASLSAVPFVDGRSEAMGGFMHERFIANLVNDFDSGKLDRREFSQSVALAALLYASGEAANAAAIYARRSTCSRPAARRADREGKAHRV